MGLYRSLPFWVHRLLPSSTGEIAVAIIERNIAGRVEALLPPAPY
jgi:hypothetical protein